jgi:sugar lactone lactonase YvrE
MTYKIKHTTLVLLISLLSACNGGGSSGGGNSDNNSDDKSTIAPDTTAPTAALLSPSLSRATTSREVVVTGSASDLESSISTVTVNGISASSEDNFASWSVNLPLNQNIDQLTLNVEDSAGNVHTQDYNISLTTISTLFSEPSSLAYDVNQDHVIILDTLQKSLFQADSAAPELILLPNNDINFGSPQKVVLDNTNQRMIILDKRNTRPASQALIAIRTSDQQRSMIKENLNNIIDFVISNDGNRIYYLSGSPNSRTGGQLSFYDTTSNLTEVISDTANTGPTIDNPSALSVFGNQAYYIEQSSDQLISIDLNSGNRSIISSKNDNQISIASVRDIAINDDGSFAWVSDTKQKKIISINLSTGSRQILSGSTNGSGMRLESPKSLVFDKVRNRLLVADTILNIVFSVDTQTGKRDYFISNRFGQGLIINSPTAIKAVSEKSAYIIDTKTNNLIKVDLVNGNRTLISSGKDTSQGSGPLFDTPSGLSINANTNTAWVIDRELAAIFEIDLSTGDRSILAVETKMGATQYKLPVAIDQYENELYISDIYLDKIQQTNSFSGGTTIALDRQLSSGTKLEKPISIDIDSSGQNIYGIDATLKSLYQIDLASGESNIISSDTRGSGISFISPISIQVDDNQNAYIADSAHNAILHIDLRNGNRTIVSNLTNGAGPVFKKLVAISLVDGSQTLLAIDTSEKALFSVNLLNGDRSIRSR